jgi:hypothetical protein
LVGELDVDESGEVDPLTDGLLVLRYLFGFRDAVLIAGAVDLMNCDACTSDDIEANIAAILPLLDVDEDGEVDPLTDGLLILRYLFGFRDEALIAGAVDLTNCNACTANEIEANIQALID